jgi:hypothetical protein
MPGILTERRQIVNHSSLLRTDRSQPDPGQELSGERRDQTVDQASELAAGSWSAPSGPLVVGSPKKREAS